MSQNTLKIKDETDGKVYLSITHDELDHQLDLFSRTFEPGHWKNVLAVSKALTDKESKDAKLAVHTWELYDRAFEFPRVRAYGYA